MTVLVAFASRHGATEGIAARIAGRIADRGTAVDLRRVDAIDSLDAYDAVVFGAPVYEQSWPPEADRFVDRNRDDLAARPLWLFSVGAFGDTKRLIGSLTHQEPKRIVEVRSAVSPREYRVFQGVIRKHQWPFWSRVLFHAFGGRLGDHRDWPVIEAWADQIALALAASNTGRQNHPYQSRPAKTDGLIDHPRPGVAPTRLPSALRCPRSARRVPSEGVCEVGTSRNCVRGHVRMRRRLSGGT